MTEPGFSIDVDRYRRLLRLKLTGFWTLDTARDFAAAEQEAARTVARRPGEHLVLADLSDFNLQSQAVVGVCQELITKGKLTAGRLAIVAGEGLARIQIKRILLRDGMEVFDSVPEAEHWLLTGERMRAAS